VNYNPKQALTGLGFTSDHADSIMTGLSAPDGLMLVTGISGARKGTTLRELIKIAPLVPSAKNFKSSFSSLTGGTENIQSLDQTFYVFPKFRTFTMVAACAETITFGGRVLSKLNASSAFDAPVRIQSIGKGPDGILSEIKLSTIICQTSLGCPCSQCSLNYDAAKDSLDGYVRMFIESRINESDTQSLRFRNREGCQNCSNGTSGFSVAAEVVVPDEEMLALFRKQAIIEAREMFIGQGGKLMIDHAIAKATKGLVDLNDVAHKIGFEPYI